MISSYRTTHTIKLLDPATLTYRTYQQGTVFDVETPLPPTRPTLQGDQIILKLRRPPHTLALTTAQSIMKYFSVHNSS